MTEVEKETQKLLRRLGANGSYKGFWFVSYGIVRVMDESELLTHVCKGLYVEVAVHFHVNVGCAERNIRTIKNLIWKNGDHELLNEIFGRQAGHHAASIVAVWHQVHVVHHVQHRWDRKTETEQKRIAPRTNFFLLT